MPPVILTVNPYPLSPTESLSKRIVRLSEALASMGVAVCLAAPGNRVKPSSFGQITLPYVLRTHTGLTTDLKQTLRLVGSALFVITIMVLRRRSLRVTQFAQVMHPPYVLLTLVAAKLLRLKIVYLMEDLYPETAMLFYGLTHESLLVKILSHLERTICQISDLTVVPSNSMARVLDRASPKKIVTVYNAINLTGMDDFLVQAGNLPLELPPSFKVVYFGRIDGRVRGLESAVQSFNYLDGTFHFLLIGPGEGRGSLSELIVQRGLADRVTIAGPYPTRTLYWIVNHCDVVLVPYSLESEAHRVAAPAKLFEAITLGKPVICPDVPGFREVLEGNEFMAYYYHESSPKSIARAIIEARDGQSSARRIASSKAYRPSDFLGKYQDISSYRKALFKMLRE